MTNVYVIQEEDYDNTPPMGVYSTPLAALLNAVKVQSESTVQYAILVRTYDLNSNVKLIKDDDELRVSYPEDDIIAKVQEISSFSEDWQAVCTLNLYFYKETNFYKANKDLSRSLNLTMVVEICKATGFEWSPENFSSETNVDVYTISKTLNKE